MTDEQSSSDDISYGEPLDIRQAIFDASQITSDPAKSAEAPSTEEADDAFYETARDGADCESLVEGGAEQDIIDADADSLHETPTAPVEDLEELDPEDFEDFDDPDEIPPLTAEQLAEDEARRLADLMPKTFRERCDDVQRGPSNARRRAVARVRQLMDNGAAADRVIRARKPVSHEEAVKNLEARLDLEQQAQLIEAGELTEEQALEHGLSQDEYDDIIEQLRPKSKAEEVIQRLEKKFDSTSQLWTGTDAELVHLTDIRRRKAIARLARNPFFSE